MTGPRLIQETITEALVQPAARRIWVHVGCGGWVLFDLQGGYCLTCGATRLRSGQYEKPQAAA